MNTTAVPYVQQMRYCFTKQRIVTVKMYRSNPPICQACPLRTQCESKDAVKRIKRYVWAEYVEEADHLRQTEENNECMRGERRQ